jgi:multisubunit Na+/H+ antiporter MnhG subunit
MIAISAILIVTNAVGAHAAARAFRVRKLDHWQPREEDGVEFIPQRPKA